MVLLRIYESFQYLSNFDFQKSDGDQREKRFFVQTSYGFKHSETATDLQSPLNCSFKGRLLSYPATSMQTSS